MTRRSISAPPIFDQIPELRALARLRTPERVQDFVSALPINFEPDGDTCWSVLQVLRRNCAHCIEGAFVAAYALWLAGERPLLMDFQADGDDDHVVALFRRDGCWGAISKSNHIWLRWRDPIYRSLRELAMSYFHEYFLDDGRKTLRQYSKPFDLSKWKGDWIASPDDLWDLQNAIDDSPHHPIVNRSQIARLRRADRIEREAGKLTEWS
jgi:hypothetical protein